MIGSNVSHYRIDGHIGAGGMGTVYLAEDTRLKRRVALKFLSPETAGSQEAAARLLREARAASALDHPHIATIYEIGEHAGLPFIAMAHYEGETLAARLARGQMTMAEVARILAQVADALEAAHAAGIVHRDVKPSNLLLTTTGQVKVLDFGIAKFETGETATQLTCVGSTVGTATYMSPEQATGETVDARSDLWSLGVVTYEMLAGMPPFKGTNARAFIQAVWTSTPVPIRTVRPDVAPELEDVVNRTLVLDRERRTITATDVRQIATACHARLSWSGQQPTVTRMSRRAQIGAALVALAVVVGGVAWWAQQNAKVRWARHQALPEIVRLAGADKFDDAYRLAQQAQRYIPGDPVLAEQLTHISSKAILDSQPAGGEAFYRPYGRTDDAWRPLGTTPVAETSVPRGLLHVKLVLAGHEMAEDVGPGPFASSKRVRFALFPPNHVPPGMVRITSRDGPFNTGIPSLEHLPGVQLPDYWIDRYEVTNRAFQQFVDARGYQRAELWQEPFVNEGRPMTFSAALTYFRDATGQPGPALWEEGRYAAGHGDDPVVGVSWYEAAAYARWAGKSLPTIYHWTGAADLSLSGDVVPASNFSGKSLLPVGALRGLTRGGTSDMAGNAKEWAWNAAGDDRYIMGGAWNEPVYMFNSPDWQSPFARHSTYGFRCIKVDRPEDLSPPLTAAIQPQPRDLRRAKPVPDVLFNAWRSLYSFDHADLKAQTERVDDSSAEWRKEKVSYAAAYGDERIPAYLFLPKNAQPPFQVVVAFSGANVLWETSSDTTTDVDRFSFIMRSGRALLYPVYKSTFERGDSLKIPHPTISVSYRDHVVMWSKDVGRSLDYLESRSDIQKTKIGFIGLSMGSYLAPLFLAIEPRLSLGVIYMGGFQLQPSLPEADMVNFAPRVKVPVLMLNGRFDNFYPTGTSQEPLFALLGTPPEQKRRLVYDSAHNIPRTEMIKEVVNWMEKYWGPPIPRR